MSGPTKVTINPVGADVVRLVFPFELVINTAYRDPGSYSVSVEKGSGSIAVREAIPPTDGLTASEVILYLDRPTKGTQYRVDITGLLRRNGDAVTAFGRFQGRRTKLETMLRGVPQHWDKRPKSVMRNVLAAISIEDDRIGGNQDDRL